MVQAAIPKTVTIPAGWVRIGSLIELMLLLLLVVLVLLALYGMNPPNRVSVNAPLSEFSSGRAMQHLKVISASSHPIGSADQNLDERSLQHHGSYVFALTRYFGNHDLNVRSGRDAVYFDLFGLGLAYSGFGAGQPRPDNIFYGQNADKHEAVWASTDASPDQWTKQFLTNPQHNILDEYFPGTVRPFLTTQADTVALPAPEIKVLNDSAQENRRIVRLRVTSIRQAPLICIYGEPDSEVREIVISGKRTAFEQGSATASTNVPWVMRYYALPAEGLELVLELQSQAKVKLRIVDQSYELPVLPNFSVTARPEDLMPSSATWNETTFVSKSFVF